MTRPHIPMPGKSPEMLHLAQRYLNLLLLHDRYRQSVSTVTRLPNVALALSAVRGRMDCQQELELRCQP